MKFLSLLALLASSLPAFSRDVDLEARASLSMAGAARSRMVTAAAPAVPTPATAGGKITVPRGDVASVGTATVIGPRRADGRWDVLTAAHVVRGAERASLAVGGKSVKLVVAVTDEKADVAWLVTEVAHEHLPFALLADRPAKAGEALWHKGCTSGECEGKALPTTNEIGTLWTDLPGSFGDSGAAIFRKSDGRVVAVLTGSPNHGAREGKQVIGGGLLRIVLARAAKAVKKLVPKRRDGEAHPDGGGWRWSAQWNCWIRERPVSAAWPSAAVRASECRP